MAVLKSMQEIFSKSAKSFVNGQTNQIHKILKNLKVYLWSHLLQLIDFVDSSLALNLRMEIKSLITEVSLLDQASHSHSLSLQT